MHTKEHPRNSLFGMNWNPANVTLVIMLTLLFLIFLFLFLTLTAQPALGQTLNVLYSFGAGSDEFPFGLTMDAKGNLYGATYYGGGIFKLSRGGSGWVLTTLYSFQGGDDGVLPEAGVIFGPSGILYGTTSAGGSQGCSGNGCGTVFSLRPPPTVCKAVSCPWTETVLYRFTGALDGCTPNADLLLDRAGNLDGTAAACGSAGGGTVFQLNPSGGGWTLNVLHSFSWGTDGGAPSGGLLSDQSGNLYGVTQYGGSPYNGGIVYGLTPSGSGWTETVLHVFQGAPDGGCPLGGLIFDRSGNLDGTTSSRGPGGDGTVFELTPGGAGWTLSVLYSFVGSGGNGPCGPGSATNLVMDTSGNLYGTTESAGAYGNGNVFKLTPSNGSWVYTSIHDFSGHDGMYPTSNLILDATGNIYGTTIYGGAYGAGVIWEITP
ncbi:MAG: choice-of-anchor tandem repeat GloVer-containing protein [Candidatus Korobacteraceae bacterium]|jgi:uncharacterized repeat protein (TIGR03803 family)